MTIKPIQKKLLSKFLKTDRKKTCVEVFIFVGLRPATLLKKRLRHKCFPVNFSKFLKTHFFTELLRWLLRPILKPLDSQTQLCKWVSKLVTIWFISTFLVLVGIFVFILGEHKLSFYFTQLKCHVNFSVEFPRPSSAPYQVLWAMRLVNVEIKPFLICHLTTWSICHVTLWLGFPHPKSSHYYV